MQRVQHTAECVHHPSPSRPPFPTPRPSQPSRHQHPLQRHFHTLKSFQHTLQCVQDTPLKGCAFRTRHAYLIVYPLNPIIQSGETLCSSGIWQRKLLLQMLFYD